MILSGPTSTDRAPVADDVVRVGFVSHDWLLPRCVAVVHPCGAGTSHAAARAGIPSVPLPLVAGQHFWAARLYDAGLAAPPLRPSGLSRARVRAALAAALVAGSRCRRVAAEMAAEDGVGAAVAAIEAALTRRTGNGPRRAT